MKKVIASIGSAILMLALASVAFAHAEIDSCTPAIDGTVETAPETMVCTAIEGIKTEGSSLKVFDANGAQVDKGDSKVDLNDPDRKTISVSLDTTKLTDGVYAVKWETVSDADGDPDSGEFKFTVGHAMEMSATPSPAATKVAVPAAMNESANSGTNTNLPVTGAQVNYAWFLFTGLGGLMMFGTGALVVVRTRR